MGEAVGSICCRSACGCRLNADCEEPWKMMGVRLAAALASAAVLAVSCASPASSTNSPAGDALPMYPGVPPPAAHPPAATLDYLALGDSVAFGYSLLLVGAGL